MKLIPGMTWTGSILSMMAVSLLVATSTFSAFRPVIYLRGGTSNQSFSNQFGSHDNTNARRLDLLQSCKFRTGVETIYDIDRTADGLLGKGAFSTVRIARHRKNHLKFAAKIVRLSGLDSKALTRLYREIMILRSLDHKYIVKFHDVFHENDMIYLIFELCTGGELFRFMIRVEMTSEGDRSYTDSRGQQLPFGERMVASITHSITEALFYCHTRRICHRDIKLENLMLFEAGDASYVKLIDFGFCKVFDRPDGLRAAVGSPYYVAREVLLASEPDAPGYGSACDLWSLGVISYMMLCGQVSWSTIFALNIRANRCK